MSESEHSPTAADQQEAMTQPVGGSAFLDSGTQLKGVYICLLSMLSHPPDSLQRAPVIVPVTTPPPGREYWYRVEMAGDWILRHVTFLPEQDATQRNVMEHADETEIDGKRLPEVVADMARYAQDRAAREAVEQGRDPSIRTPSYLVIHIEAMTSLTAQLSQALQATINIYSPRQPNSPQHLLHHYDDNPNEGRWGFIYLGRQAALVAGLSSSTKSILLSLLQSGTLSSAGRGFTRATYDRVVTRVVSWNLSQDIAESVGRIALLSRGVSEAAEQLTTLKQQASATADHLQTINQQMATAANRLDKLVMSTDAATEGTIWLSYALAAIGITFALYPLAPGVHQPELLAAGLIMMACACIAFAVFARLGLSIWRHIGWAASAISVILILSSLLWGSLVPQPAVHQNTIPASHATSTPQATHSAAPLP